MLSVNIQIFIITLLILINGLFAMSEISVMTARKGRLQQLADEGNRAASQALDLEKTLSRPISVMRIGGAGSAVLCGALSILFFAQPVSLFLETFCYTGPYSLPLAFVVILFFISFLLLSLGEMLPKRMALINPDRLALMLSPMVFTWGKIILPLSFLLNTFVNLFLRLLNLANVEEIPVTQQEIKLLMAQAAQEGVLEESEQDMLTGVMRLGNRYVDVMMTPRTEIFWLDLEDSFEEILKQVQDNHFSIYPVARGSLDNVLGLLESQTFLLACLSGKQPDLEGLLIKPLYIPETKLALEALEMIKSQGVSLGLVIDEYGGLLGMVTLFDILESIVGDMPDNGEEDEPQIVQRADGSWLLDGMLPIDELKEILNVDNFPEEERVGFQTLAGLILNHLGYIPNAGSRFEWGRFVFEVVDMDGLRIDKVIVSPLSSQA
ncbi:MAG: hemolysin family protein, partial [Anaerolineae bacterium]|nr:hemolysin family protein [Anaerolineae bacterium]